MHPSLFPRYLWMDDNGWVCAIQLLLARIAPELDARYQFSHWASILGKELHKAFARSFIPDKEGQLDDPEHLFNGRLELPHWAAPLLCALTLYLETLPPGEEANEIHNDLQRYLDYILPKVQTTNASELGYLMLLAGTMMFSTQFYIQGQLLAENTHAELQKRMDSNPYGILPAEHFEAPPGPHLADLTQLYHSFRLCFFFECIG